MTSCFHVREKWKKKNFNNTFRSRKKWKLRSMHLNYVNQQLHHQVLKIAWGHQKLAQNSLSGTLVSSLKKSAAQAAVLLNTEKDYPVLFMCGFFFFFFLNFGVNTQSVLEAYRTSGNHHHQHSQCFDFFFFVVVENSLLSRTMGKALPVPYLPKVSRQRGLSK